MLSRKWTPIRVTWGSTFPSKEQIELMDDSYDAAFGKPQVILSEETLDKKNACKTEQKRVSQQ